MNLSLAILLVLRDVKPHMMPERAILADVRLAGGVDEDVTLTSLRTRLNSLEGRGEAIGVANEDTGTRWRITDAGEARLANARL